MCAHHNDQVTVVPRARTVVVVIVHDEFGGRDEKHERGAKCTHRKDDRETVVSVCIVSQNRNPNTPNLVNASIAHDGFGDSIRNARDLCHVYLSGR